jgi:hypothetical protein
MEKVKTKTVEKERKKVLADGCFSQQSWEKTGLAVSIR